MKTNYSLSCMGLAALLLAVESGCVTVAPKPIEAHQIAFDGNVRNAGIISVRKEGGFYVTKAYLEKWDALVSAYGSKIMPKIKVGDGIGHDAAGDFIDDEHAADLRTLNIISK